MNDKYDLTIEDIKPTREEIRRIINRKIKTNRAATKTVKGLEIDVPDAWVETLQGDAAILYDYGEVGWKVMWYNIHSEGPGEGDLVRSWISIKHERTIAKEKRR